MTEDNFFSINRLVEFGMGIAVAQQMVKIMNDSMQNMHVAGAMNQIQTTQQQYYAVIDSQRSGPYNKNEFSNLITKKAINKESLVWRPGMSNWEVLEKVPDILMLVALQPPPIK